MKATKTFVSYSWSSPEHEEWVLDLATSLRQSGVDVLLDKWDLKEGHEASAFMEKMVSDSEIKKVIIVCDRTYAEKSNAREGGAGTEAQIISKELYQQEDQDKFVAVIVEKDDDDSAYVPAYYTSRIYIDFSDSSRYSESFEKLLRWIADKPIHKKPELGKVPAYLSDDDGVVTLATSALKRRAYDAIAGSKEYAPPAAKDYFELFTEELEKFRLNSDVDPLADGFMSNLDSFVPYRNEFLEVVKAIARYTRDEQYPDLLHEFFDRFLQYYEPPEWMKSYQKIAFDNYKFFGHELLLHCAAILVAEKRHDLFNALIGRQYYLEAWARHGGQPVCEFTAFRDYPRSLEAIGQKSNSRPHSVAADLLNQRAANSGSKFRKLMEVDFILFLRAELANFEEFNRWWPDTLVYLGFNYRTFEIFERSRSTRYFEKIRPFLANATKADLEKLLAGYERNDQRLPRWEMTQVNPGVLMGIQNLCTRP
ncbi:MAG: TIR domain-containing protein [Gammaproteobacteria bacterium]|nr:TIR domain-containing protein [Gammaproteobacteria bacterium]